MKYFGALTGALLLTGCASFSGVSGQYQSTETVAIAQQPSNFYDDVVAVGQQLGYQHAGGNRSNNTVQLTDQPNFGESVIMGRAYAVSVSVKLLPNGRDIELLFVATGGRATAGSDKSQRRIDELKTALQQRFGAR